MGLHSTGSWTVAITSKMAFIFHDLCTASCPHSTAQSKVLYNIASSSRKQDPAFKCFIKPLLHHTCECPIGQSKSHSQPHCKYGKELHEVMETRRHGPLGPPMEVYHRQLSLYTSVFWPFIKSQISTLHQLLYKSN